LWRREFNTRQGHEKQQAEHKRRIAMLELETKKYREIEDIMTRGK
jgi:hypothetical protein